MSIRVVFHWLIILQFLYALLFKVCLFTLNLAHASCHEAILRRSPGLGGRGRRVVYVVGRILVVHHNHFLILMS